MKFYDIWKNENGVYKALFSYADYKTTEQKGFKYLNTISSISAKDAINDFYQQNKNIITLNKKCIKQTGNIKSDIILWSKKIKEEIPSCPLQIALLLSKKLFSQNEDQIQINDLSSINFSWVEKLKEQDKLESIYYEYSEPILLNICYMFGEDKIFESHEKYKTDVLSKILNLVEEDKRKETFDLIEKLLKLQND